MASERLADGDSRYYLLKVAHEQFGCAPGELSEEQLQQADRIIGRQRHIEDAVLRSPDAIGVVIPPSQLEEAWAHIASRYESPEALQQALDAQALDAAGMRAMLARELRVEAVLDCVCAGLPEISDTDVSLYYFNHAEQFKVPAQHKARHILVTINEDFPENTREAARTRIETILKRLRGKPERFAEQAMKHSECPTAMQGGLLGEVVPGTLYPELDACLFQMARGELSPVLESPIGFHVLYCESVSPARQLTLEEILPRLRDRLQLRQRKAYQRKWLESLLQQNATLENLAHG
ncbi:Nitrogen fixation cis-trans peptidyl prolyl isomerase, NifM [Azotobacter vinelandii CA]|uniref:peptidylprolyl isomerase n=2 Tax=Azotobacter vinelandii TaxID=354 RepID=C1DH25_AZOVD|nr:nitrogen fixation protein NifM [Azotobacter vinelandii]AOG20752.1 NifM [Cloning vector pMON261406]QHR96998.1 NifM [synthetic construct]ACO76432.1 Nitrogen fixation cis-trans peptidyl prolyl isomerase, NifM [Azotobacter vinelandii DJ]AGK13783.1 Nitrogen fixation cis-trans peptidyl prolyl isomerase, NifM [Azotobacter vinelandii CA]AGK18385.1 Nitrogen fixation cis-trans peptidyl prolyl isomerase, NifM [Azotobacter vinelandii CA6]